MRCRWVFPVLFVLVFVGRSPVEPARGDDAPTWNGRDSLPEVKAAVEEVLGGDADDERRAEIHSFLDGLGTLQEADAKKWAKRLLKRVRKHGPKISRKSGEIFEHGGLSAKIYTAGRPKRNGALFIALHGGGEGAGDGKTATQKWSLVQSKAFVLAPTTPRLVSSAWNQPDIEQWVLALIDAAKRSFPIDTNRIYVAGHSMGGYGTWSLGCRHADRFAALGACAGGVFVVAGGGDVRIARGHVPNLLNTPIWFFNSTDDPRVSPVSSQAANRELVRLKAEGYAYEWVYEEYDDIGHGLPPKGLKPILDWMLEKKRDPYPKHVVWEPSRPHKRSFFWLGLERDVRIEGRIEGNEVTIDAARGSQVTVFLSRELVDVEKPVTVRLNGEVVHEGVVPARLSVLLDTIAEGQDPKQYYDRCVTVP